MRGWDILKEATRIKLKRLYVNCEEVGVYGRLILL